MPDRNLGSAFFTVYPETTGFLPELIGKVKPMLASFKPQVTVRVDADTKPAETSITALVLRSKAATDALASMRADVKTTAAEASIARVQALGMKLQRQLASMTMAADTTKIDAQIAKKVTELEGLRKKLLLAMDADTSPLDAKILAKQAQIARLNQQMSSLHLDVNTARAAEKLVKLQVEEDVIKARLDKIAKEGLDVDTRKMDARLAVVRAELAELADAAGDIQLSAQAVAFLRQAALARAELIALQKQAADIRLGLPAQVAAFRAEIVATQAEIDRLRQHAADVRVAGVDPVEAAAADAAVLRLEADLERLRAAEEGAADGADHVGHSIHNANGLIRGFGIALTATIGGVAVWHIALDAIIEAVISLTTAAVAAAVGIAALAPAAENIADRFKAMQAVTSALHQEVGPLTGKFHDLAKSLAPQAIELYGGAVNLLSTQTGILSKTAHEVVGLFTDWTARLDIWSQHQAHAGSILKIGTEYLSQFAELFGQLIVLINNLVKADPGIAKFLLDFFIGLTKVLNAVTSIAPELIKFLLVVHGIYLWGSVLVGILGKMGLYFANMGKAIAGVIGPMLGLTEASGKMAGSFLGLSAVSWAWIAVAVIAIGLLVWAFFQADKATKDFISSLNQSVDAMPASQAATAGLAGGIRSVREEMDKAQARAGNYAIGLSDAFSRSGSFAKEFGKDLLRGDLSLHGILKTSNDASGALNNLFHAFMGGTRIGSVFRTTQNDMNAFRGEIVKLNAEQTVLFRTTGTLIRQGYSVSQSFALMDLAGVKAGDSFEVAGQKVKNLITGYQSLSIQGGILANGVDAVTFAALQQDSKVTQLTTAWEAFLKLITGGETTFASFETQLYAIGQAAVTSGDKLSLSNGKASLSLKGLETASKDTHNSMTGLSLGSLQLRQSFSTGVTNAGQLMGALMDLASAAGQGAHGTDMLTAAGKDAVAQLLPMAKGSSAATTEVYALAQMAGYQGAPSFKALSQWVGTSSGSMKEMGKEGGPAKQLDKIVGDLTASAGTLADDVKKLSVALGTTLTDAMAAAILQASGGQKAFDDFASAALNSKTKSSDLQKAANALACQMLKVSGNATDAKKQFETFAIGGLHKTKKEADDLWNTFVKEKLTEAAGKAGTTKKSFENLATQLGETKGHADKLWDALHRLPSGKSITITEEGLGKFSISQTMTAANNPAFGISGRKAAGGYISTGTGPTADDQLIWASKGELVVPANMVAAGAVDHLRGALPGFAKGGAIPGFAAGGLVPSYQGDIGGLAPWTTTNTNAFETTMTNAMKSTMTAATKTAQAAAQAAAAGGGFGGDSGARSGSAALAQAFAKSIMWQYHWGADQWPPWLFLGNQESGWNAYAVNASSGAYGIGQSLGHGHPYNLGDYKTQVIWMANYIRGRYGTPSAAWAHEVSNNWYSEGGPVGGGIPRSATGGLVRGGDGASAIPGFAAGGMAGTGMTTAQLRYWLGAAQYGELAKYFGLHHSFAIGPSKYRTATVNSELHTLAARQAAEAAAYKAVISGSMTAAEVRHLGATARAEYATAGDKALSAMPGGHPGWASDLRHYLGQVSALTGTKIPGAPGLGAIRSIAAPVLWQKDPDLSALLRSVNNEMHIFWHLMGSKLPKGATTAQHKTLAAWDRALERQQVHTIGLGKGGLFQQLMDSFRNGRPPQWDAFGGAVDYMIREVEGTGIPGGINPPGTPRNSGWVPWHYFHGQWANLLSALHLVRGRLTPAAPWKPGNLGPSHTAPDGVLQFARGGLVFDRGGVLQPGWNPPMFNGTGRDEHLVPAGAGGLHLHLTVHGPVGSQAELEDWYIRTANKLARTGKLTQAVRTAGG